MPDSVALEERVAHLIRAVDELSDVVARQDREIDRLRLQLRHLLERDAARDGTPEPDRPPPHW